MAESPFIKLSSASGSGNKDMLAGGTQSDYYKYEIMIV